MSYTISTGSSFLGRDYPTAFIAQNRKRIKQFGDTVYLRNGSNFEVELFNPMKSSVLVKLHINGIPLSDSGIILKPGQRVFLERMIDTNNKFVFSAYEVENSIESINAIQNNGVVQIEFYQEYIPTGIPWVTHPYWYGAYNTTTGGIHYSNVTGTTTSSTVFGASTLTNCSSNLLCDSKVETGRIEKGNHSSQKFDYSYENFESWSFKTVIWKILPDSRKPITVQELTKKYCTECGSKIKKSSYKFCPICGNKL